jgi:dephospho-CoA kinase
LGSGKSTVGRMFAELGAAVIDADEVGRKLMQPGKSVYERIVKQFGRNVVREDGALDRRALAELAFTHGRLHELNSIVHPAVIAAQEEWLRDVFAANPHAIAVIESALIFEASGKAGEPGSVPGWQQRFDHIILVTAPDDLKIKRFVQRSLCAGGVDIESLAADARKRLATQIPDVDKVPLCEWVIDNSGDIDLARTAVASIYAQLQAATLYARPQ